MEARKFIIPTAVVIGGVIVYKQLTTDYRQLLSSSKEFDKNYHLVLNANATAAQKKKYVKEALNAYKVKTEPLATGIIKDATNAEAKKMVTTSSIFTTIINLFVSKKFNDGIYTLTGLKEAKSKYQLAILLNRIYSISNLDVKKKIIDEYSNKSCKEIYEFIKKLPTIKTS